MKKTLSFILSLILMLSFFVTAFGDEPIGFEATQIVMGDVNFDGKVNTKDARLILRIAAKLEKAELYRNSYDTDGNGKLSVADARQILKCVAKLSKLTVGFGDYDEDTGINVLNVTNAINDGTYSVKFTEDGNTIDFTVCNHNKFLVKFPYELFSDGDMSEEEVKKMMKVICSFVPEYMLVLDGKIYFTGNEKDETGKTVPVAADATAFMQGEDMSFFNDLDIFKNYTSFKPDSMITVNLPDGSMNLRFAQTNHELGTRPYVALYTDCFGNLLAVEEGRSNNSESYVELDNFTGIVNEKLFSISYYNLVE